MKRHNGKALAISAYVMWGLLPLYWKLLAAVPALEILAHRIIWSWGFIAVVLFARREHSAFFKQIQSGIHPGNLAGTAILLGINWGTYVWAINHNHVVEASLGYFINPLISVLIGVILLKEKLSRWQWLAVLLAAAGVLFLAVVSRTPIWIGLILALTFGVYGYLRKIGPWSSLDGLFGELGILLPPSLLILIVTYTGAPERLWSLSPDTGILLVCAGVVTAVPLFLYILAVRLTRLSLMGILQYLVPTLQFILGVFVFRESFSMERALGFSLIWCALILFLISERRVQPAEQV